ncbi:unnamed protein product [Schistosoma turkestanicum]|nr:unnamed protein product [Schistosoma turkestanicum]
MNETLLEKFVHNYELKLKETYRNCDTYRLSEYNAAVQIQAWFRGIRIRCYLKLVEKCTILIQKTWRGYLGRKRYRSLLSKAVIEYRRNKFSKAAAKIQSAWKGYLTRKYIFNFYARKVYLEALKDIGEFVKHQLSEYEKEMKYLEYKKEQENERNRIINWAKSHHFLVSTRCQPGIYQNPLNKESSDKEKLLLSVARQESTRRIKKNKQLKKLSTKQIDEFSYQIDSCHHSQLNQESTATLPKIKGPFKNPNEVKKWISTPVNLSLRVSTDYFSLKKAQEIWKSEEWTNRLHDDIFHTGRPPSIHYERLLWTTSVYGSIPYGTKHFRHTEDVANNNNTAMDSQKPKFRNVLPPIALFDKFNKEYIPGYATG